MDRVLKFVYDKTLDGQLILNGMHPAIKELIKKEVPLKSINNVIETIKQQNTESSWTAHINHANFLFYAKKHFSNEHFVSPEQIANDNSIYLLPIEICTVLNDLIAPHSFNLNLQTHVYSFKDTLSIELLTHLQTGKVKLLLDIIHDPLQSIDALLIFEKQMAEIGISGDNIICIAGNNFQDYYKAAPSSKIKITHGIITLPQYAKFYKQMPYRSNDFNYISDCVRPTDLNSSVIRPNRFVSFNRSIDHKEHRVLIAYFAIRYNLLKDGIFSFLNCQNTDMILPAIKYFVDQREDVELIAKQIESMIPYELDTQHFNQTQRHNFNVGTNNKDYYISSYVHLVGETSFCKGDTIHPFISEKTWRPIMNLQPFLMFGDRFTLKTLHDLGFKTFHPFINETYDTVEDCQQRMELIEIELVKLNNMSKIELHDWYYSISDILVYNQNHLASFSEMNPFAHAFDNINNWYQYD